MRSVQHSMSSPGSHPRAANSAVESGHLDGQDSAAGWLPVTQRMTMRMQWMSNYGRTPIRAPAPAELQTLTEYLQKHASK
jgi:hypothetical protein